MKNLNIKKDTLVFNKSRRRSFVYFGAVSLLVFSSVLPTKTKKDMFELEDEFVFVNGWVLKKEDIYDL